MVVVNRWEKAQLWRNLGSGKAAAPAPLGHWLQLRLRQTGGNRDAVGAWVEVQTGERVQREELTVGGGHASGHLGWMHFGLGEAAQARVRVQWPGSGWSDWVAADADGFYMLDRQSGLRPWSAP
jgi:hypothetical protein